jgi:hypothetical protein
LKVVHAEVAEAIMIQLEKLLGTREVEIGIIEDRRHGCVRRELEEASEVFRSVKSASVGRRRITSARELGSAVTRRKKPGDCFVRMCDVQDGKVAARINGN